MIVTVIALSLAIIQKQKLPSPSVPVLVHVAVSLSKGSTIVHYTLSRKFWEIVLGQPSACIDRSGSRLLPIIAATIVKSIKPPRGLDIRDCGVQLFYVKGSFSLKNQTCLDVI